MVGQLLREVEETADGLTDRVVAMLLDALGRTGTRICRKHGELQAAASVAAIALYRYNKRHKQRLWGPWVNESENVYRLEERRAQTSRAYHEAECTCWKDEPKKAPYPSTRGLATHANEPIYTPDPNIRDEIQMRENT